MWGTSYTPMMIGSGGEGRLSTCVSNNRRFAREMPTKMHIVPHLLFPRTLDFQRQG